MRIILVSLSTALIFLVGCGPENYIEGSAASFNDNFYKNAVDAKEVDMDMPDEEMEPQDDMGEKIAESYDAGIGMPIKGMKPKQEKKCALKNKYGKMIAENVPCSMVYDAETVIQVDELDPKVINTEDRKNYQKIVNHYKKIHKVQPIEHMHNTHHHTDIIHKYYTDVFEHEVNNYSYSDSASSNEIKQEMPVTMHKVKPVHYKPMKFKKPCPYAKMYYRWPYSRPFYGRYFY